MLTIIFVLFITFLLCLPEPIFNDPTSTILNDKSGKLLAAKIADDGQWRFPLIDSVPVKFEKCILNFEDQYFYYHPGINPVSLVKAVFQNIRAGEIVRGGSTLTLQVIRLSRKNKPRKIREKLIEFVLALRLEMRYSKKEILAMYVSHAPFGGNVVGLEAASWRYYNRPPSLLSWGESATLAVLPNAPALIYPGKNHEFLLAKRNRLLDKLCDNKVIDTITCDLAKMEPLPEKPNALPQTCPHLLNRAIAEGYKGNRITTTIDADLQYKANRLIDRYHKLYVNNEIYNTALLILDVYTKDVLVYVGNTNSQYEETGKDVDMITASRSSGSILKPFLYTWMMKDGELLPNMLLPDIPTHFKGFSPKNFNETFDGAVPAGNALARSLNVPAVRLLQDYGIETFYTHINNTCISTIKKPANHYGLSLILGGAEVKLWEVCQLYAGMSSSLNHFTKNSARYFENEYGASSYIARENSKEEKLTEQNLFGAGAIWCTFEALKQMDRPIEGTNWHRYVSSKKIAWKTGTSYGHKDAWSVGVTPQYVIGVWVGNADGEGRPGLTGAGYAAPILFDMYKLMPKTTWWEIPHDDLIEMEICTESGYKASQYCTKKDTVLIPVNGARSPTCPYHKLIHLDKSRQYRVNGQCYPVVEMQTESWFVLPPVMEWFYKRTNPFYKSLPPYLEGCYATDDINMDIIYPEKNTLLFIPRGFDGDYQTVVFEAVHRLPGTTLFWYIDNQLIAKTKSTHRTSCDIIEGRHKLTLVSEFGEEKVRYFEVVERD